MTSLSGTPTPPEAAWRGVSAAFAALGRVFLCLDQDFRVLHASDVLDSLLGPGTAHQVVGRDAEEVLGADLFGPGGALREALLAGQRREGWRALLRTGATSRLVAVTVAPFPMDPLGLCDPRVWAVIVLRPAEDDASTLGGPTSFGGVIARSPGMARVLRLVETLEQSEATVLLTGESGTGKEVVARALHDHSPRRGGPFVAVSCGALPGELLESELFGHVRGAFTGAVRDRVGRFEAAAGGTLFLDEVGDIPLHLQVKLLRVLQEHSFERVGESRTRKTDARVIAATHVDLQRAVAEGRFREDLYYRLRVVPITLPTLRARREDVEPLAHSLLARVGARQGRTLRLSPDALRVLLAHAWPGNVRELENALEYAVAVCRGQTILPEDLPVEVLEAASSRQPAQANGGGGSQRTTPAQMPVANPEVRARDRLAEAARLRALLDAHRWQRAAVAEALGVSRTTLWRRMRELGLADE